MPEVPTMQQAGFKDSDINTWIGLLVPAGSPDAVVQRLHREVVRIVREPDVREQFRTLGMLPVTGGSFASSTTGIIALPDDSSLTQA